MKKIVPVILTVLSWNAIAANPVYIKVIDNRHSDSYVNTTMPGNAQKMQKRAMPEHRYVNNRRDMDRYDNRMPEQRDWYIAARAELAFWTFEKVLSLEPAIESSDTEKYPFKPVFGGNLSVGKWFGSNWRGDIEVGYLGQFREEKDNSKVIVQAPYAVLNGYYNFDNGLYLGLGAGVAMPIVTTSGIGLSPSGTVYTNGDSTKVGAGFMGAVMLGYSIDLSDSIALDLRYRLSGITGGTTTESEIVNASYILKNKVGFILSNSISVGLRYSF